MSARPPSMAIARAASHQPIDSEDAGFSLRDFRVFTSIPEHNHDVIALRGMVVVFETGCLGREGIQEGMLYVRESQRPYACMDWERWLQLELNDEDVRRRAGPVGPLKIHREVVRAVRWPRADDWALRLESGFVDGPYNDWAFGHDLIGRVVGIYQPTART